MGIGHWEMSSVGRRVHRSPCAGLEHCGLERATWWIITKGVCVIRKNRVMIAAGENANILL